MPNNQFKIKSIAGAFSRIPVHLLGALTGTRFIVPYYHLINDEEVLHVKHLYPFKNTRQFKEDLEFLVRYYHPVHLLDLLSSLRNGTALPKKAFLLTFDDGFREIYDIIAPILFDRGIPATFFINSSFTDNKSLCSDHKASLLVEQIRRTSAKKLKMVTDILAREGIRQPEVGAGLLSVSYQQKGILDEIAQVLDVDFQDYLLKHRPYMTTKQIRTVIDKGFTVGGHSEDHPRYSSIGFQEQLRQTVESLNFIQEKFGVKYLAFAFPYSDQGVSVQFFEKLSEAGAVDICFGTAGMMEDSCRNMIQRFSLEKTMMPARKIIAYQYARKLFRIVSGRGVLARTSLMADRVSSQTV